MANGDNMILGQTNTATSATTLDGPMNVEDNMSDGIVIATAQAPFDGNVSAFVENNVVHIELSKRTPDPLVIGWTIIDMGQ